MGKRYFVPLVLVVAALSLAVSLGTSSSAAGHGAARRPAH